MADLKKAKEKGLSPVEESNLFQIRGCILDSHLSNENKNSLCSFINDLEEYFNTDEQ